MEDGDEASGDDDVWPGSGRELTEGEPKLFACPFYRRSPIRHRDCVNRRLTRIRDVKQHIQRRHIGGAYYCSICFKSHASLQTHDEHIRSRLCAPRSPPILDSLRSNSKEAEELVRYRANRTYSPEEQWHQIWDLLFKDGPKARSAYLGTEIEETLGIIRKCWEQESQQIDQAYLARVGVKVEPDTDIKALVNRLFDRVQRRFEQRADGSNPARILETEPYYDQSDELTAQDATVEYSVASPTLGGDPGAVTVGLSDTNSDGSVSPPPNSSFLQGGSPLDTVESPSLEQYYSPMDEAPHMYYINDFMANTAFNSPFSF